MKLCDQLQHICETVRKYHINSKGTTVFQLVLSSTEPTKTRRNVRLTRPSQNSNHKYMEKNDAGNIANTTDNDDVKNNNRSSLRFEVWGNSIYCFQIASVPKCNFKNRLYTLPREGLVFRTRYRFPCCRRQPYEMCEDEQRILTG